MKRVTVFAVAGWFVVLLATGCADQKERMMLLEQRNRDMAGQISKMLADLDEANRRAAEAQRLAAAAAAENDRLAAALAAAETIEQPPPGWTAVPGGAMIAIEGSVLFASGKVVLRNEAQRTLDAIASTITMDYPHKDILVYGHTDNVPIKKSGWDDNWQLSTERALAVVRALRERSVPPERLAACGCGEFRPLADNTAEAGRARNRRVEIFALDATAQTGRR